jgi:hypothetical protein
MGSDLSEIDLNGMRVANAGGYHLSAPQIQDPDTVAASPLLKALAGSHQPDRTRIQEDTYSLTPAHNRYFFPLIAPSNRPGRQAPFGLHADDLFRMGQNIWWDLPDLTAFQHKITR